MTLIHAAHRRPTSDVHRSASATLRAAASLRSSSAPAGISDGGRGARDADLAVLIERAIDTLKEKGIRSDYIVLVGGAPLNETFAQSVGADAYCRDAAIAVETAKALLASRQGSAQQRGIA